MSLLGKKWPVPVAKPMFPFFAAGLIVLYGVNAAANASMACKFLKNIRSHYFRRNSEATRY
ncbi:mitochondrial F1F0 ATP synthase subunit Atp18, putative [Talaromyces marneffei ATCC 18224]|uniref:Mitochondrial F1F0 ATP synthase subunit Atp18, putative n=1 Tax=Talaromyces marneffei (strain ATCC 18224 / CBS 334.59 / QM 7333) TaxID=441960 RepID=B6QQS5_TALMQ|nr:mitochondrial F1F0 ATP synthase subunit Atp18, putative [Talaromyces marneffei ATCC 18224]